MPWTFEPECSICEERVTLDIPDGMLIYRVGTEAGGDPMRSDPRLDERVVTECEAGHEVAVLLMSESRSDLPEHVENQKQQLQERKREEENQSLDEFL